VILHRFFGLVLFLPLRSGSACHQASFHAFEKSAEKQDPNSKKSHDTRRYSSGIS